jgi:hypothetical protein
MIYYQRIDNKNKSVEMWKHIKLLLHILVKKKQKQKQLHVSFHPPFNYCHRCPRTVNLHEKCILLVT